MRYLFYLLPRVGVVLEAVLLFCLLKNPLRSKYPYVLIFVAFSLVRDIALFPIVWYRPALFARAYWQAETVASFLAFGIDWEFFRHLYPRGTALHDLGKKAMIIACVGLPMLILLAYGQARSFHHDYTVVSPIFVQYMSLAQALLLAAPAAVARYYAVPTDRTLRALGLGFTLYVSTRCINVATLQALPRFFRVWQVLSPLTFLGMIAIWLWAFIGYGAVPEVARDSDLARSIEGRRTL